MAADLPAEVLKKVFDLLSIRERLRLRSTCKAWKSVIESFNLPQNLKIYSTKRPYNERWCFSNQIVTEDEMLYLKFNCDPSRRFSLKIEFFRQNLLSLSLYYVNYLNELDLFLEELNGLCRVHFESESAERPRNAALPRDYDWFQPKQLQVSQEIGNLAIWSGTATDGANSGGARSFESKWSGTGFLGAQRGACQLWKTSIYTKHSDSNTWLSRGDREK